MSVKQCLTFFLFFSLFLQASASCGNKGVWLQVLGSGGPEVDNGRASSSYVIWNQGKARILVDMGAGSLLRFKQSGASINDLDVMLVSHLHADHSNDLPAYIKASYFSDRDRDLLLYGPTGNHLMPSLSSFVENLLGQKGAFRYLSDYLDGRELYRLLPHDVDSQNKQERVVMQNDKYRIVTVSVHHGQIPALAWRVDLSGYSIVFSGDMSNQNSVLASLSRKADILVAHHAIAEQSRGIARRLHMPPSVIGKIAAKAGVKKLILSHRMNRTLGKEKVTVNHVRETYSGPLELAEDLQCFKL